MIAFAAASAGEPASPKSDSAERPGCVKLKLDENIPQSAATRLATLGYDVDTVLDEQLGHGDRNAAQGASGSWLLGRALTTTNAKTRSQLSLTPRFHS